MGKIPEENIAPEIITDLPRLPRPKNLFKVRPKKWWWRWWPPKRRIVRTFETWINSDSVARRLEDQINFKIITGQWKMTVLNYTLDLEDQNGTTGIPINKVREEMGRGK